MTPSQNNDDVITSVTVSQLSQTPLDELILPPVMVPQLQMKTEKPSTTANIPFQLEPLPMHITDTKTEPLSFGNVQSCCH